MLDDDDDMADIYLTRKLAGVSSSVSVSDEPLWYPTSPTIGSKISRASRMSLVSVRGDVEELEMLLEVCLLHERCLHICFHLHKTSISLIFVLTGLLHANRQHFEQINRGTVSSCFLMFLPHSCESLTHKV